ncbi:iron chelate uptake ABC transporter family permease subunit, partial [Bacteroidales bacterium MSK.15.36]|nr:iron chelate uptake ABC transporter family permease subunit [Bacteroidales bacterium MSK.15.36]
MSSTKKNSYYSITFIIMACMLFISIILSSTLGVANITFSKSMQILMSKIPFINKLLNVDNISETHKLIIINIRLPRIILSALIGAGLSVVGCVFQAIFKNPMADPYVLGISSGSALGASISIVMG